MARIRNLLLLTLLSFPFLAHASESQSKTIATQASECGALYMILTSIPPDVLPGIGKAFTDLGQTMSFIQGVNLLRSTGSPASNGDISNAKSIKMDELGNTFDADPDNVYELYYKCDQWRIEIAKLYQAYNLTSESSKSEFKDLFHAVGIRPSSFIRDGEKEQRVRGLVDLSFDYWTKSGRLTPMKVNVRLQEIKMELQKKESID
jgi:hypothetical protein